MKTVQKTREHQNYFVNIRSNPAVASIGHILARIDRRRGVASRSLTDTDTTATSHVVRRAMSCDVPCHAMSHVLRRPPAEIAGASADRPTLMGAARLEFHDKCRARYGT